MSWDVLINNDVATLTMRYPFIDASDFFLAKTLMSVLPEEVSEIARLHEDEKEILYISFLALNQSLREGHSCLNLRDWAGVKLGADDMGGDEPKSGEGLPLPDIDKWDRLLQQLNLTPEADLPVIYEYQCLYLRRYWQFEQSLAGYIQQRQQDVSISDPERLRSLLNELFDRPTTDEIDWQKVATANALCGRLALITGGPGTGKTTTVIKLLSALIALNTHRDATQAPPPLVIKMVAPTGKAAQRLSESIRGAKTKLLNNHQIDPQVVAQIPEQASTIHRLLGVQPHSPNFRRNEKNPLQLDVLLVDEVSMVDLPMMTRLFRALPDHARVILLGDPDQLPSVEAGSVLADLVPANPCYSEQRRQQLAALTGFQLAKPNLPSQESNYLCRLVKSYRFKEDGGIGNLARQVIQGEANASWQQLVEGNEEVSLESLDLQAWIQQLVDQYYRPLMRANNYQEAFALLDKFRLLTPTRVGDFGVESLNLQIAEMLGQKRQAGDHISNFHGRPIIILQNNYDLQLFNGDTGLIWFDKTKNRLRALFPSLDKEGKPIYRDFSPTVLPAYESVYAMTIHKTQGSEFDRVGLLVPPIQNRVLTRELLYTGITRAKQQVMVHADPLTWKDAVNRRVSRASCLAQRLLTPS